MQELIFAAWMSQAIAAAADLGIADTLAKEPLGLHELADRVGADPDALKRLLRALIGRGILRTWRGIPPANPPEGLPRPSADPARVRFPGLGELHRAFAAADQPADPEIAVHCI